MTNCAGVTEGLIVVAPIRTGEAEAARTAITAQPGGDASPFARVPGTHVVRVQVVNPPARRWRGRAGDYVLLAADVDAPVTRWLAAACEAIPDELDAMLSPCTFWPGAAYPADVRNWVEANRCPVGFSIIGSPQATVGQVGEALALQAHVREFAVGTQDADPATLHAAWHRWRGA